MMKTIARQKTRKNPTIYDMGKREVRNKIKHHLRAVEGAKRVSISSAAIILQRMFKGSLDRGMKS